MSWCFRKSENVSRCRSQSSHLRWSAGIDRALGRPQMTVSELSGHAREYASDSTQSEAAVDASTQRLLASGLCDDNIRHWQCNAWQAKAFQLFIGAQAGPGDVVAHLPL